MALRDSLHRAVASGEFAAVAEELSPDVVLRSSSERGVVVVKGREAVVAHLSAPGPGDVPHWHAEEWAPGVAATFEWVGATGPDRRRWYLRRSADGLVSGWWSYAARPAPGGAEASPPPVPDAVPLGGAGGNSGASLYRAGERIFKRLAPGEDWLGRATQDDGRTARLWRAGAFDRMPQVIDHGVVDVGEPWVVMRDVGRFLLDADRSLSRDESRRVLAAAAAMHAAFAGDVPDGAAPLDVRLGMSGFSIAEAERPRPDLLPKQFELAWEAFAAAVDADVADPVLAAVRNPRPLARALIEAAGGATLIHGDLRDDNLGFDGARVVLIDWDLATAGTPAVEFAWYLAQDAWRIEATHDEIEADFRAAEPAVGDAEADLGAFSGLVQYGWIFGHSLVVHPDPAEQAWAREELDWWVPRVRRALERTGAPA